MGDRSNVYVVSAKVVKTDEGWKRETFEEAKNEGLYLYSHWGGNGTNQNLQEALIAARPRWDDESYCIRILIDQYFKDDRDSETGAGISRSITSGEYPLVTLDVIGKRIGWGTELDGWSNPDPGEVKFWLDWDVFVELDLGNDWSVIESLIEGKA